MYTFHSNSLCSRADEKHREVQFFWNPIKAGEDVRRLICPLGRFALGFVDVRSNILSVAVRDSDRPGQMFRRHCILG